MASSKVAPETVGKAVDALLKWNKSRSSKEDKPQLLEHDEFFYLILTLKKIPPKGRTNPYKIPLPHSLHPIDASEELCLIIDDRSSKSSLSSDSAKKKIKAEDIPITKVLKLSKLKTDYRPFEAKRKLCDSFDMFFADKGIIPLLPKLLGKQFFKKKKIPVPVDLTQKNWKEQIERASSSALLYLKTGTCSVIKVGRVSQTRDEVVENVVAAIEGAAEIVPKKWANVRSLHLKMSESLALPVYQSVPEIGLKIEGVKKETEVPGENSAQDEAAAEEKEKRKVVKKKLVPKKGRIHQVRYMDDDLGEILNDVSGGDNDGEKGTEEMVKSASAELSSKKRKKADSMKNGSVPHDSNEKKQLDKKLSKVKKGAKKADAEIQKDGLSLAEERTDGELKKNKKKRTTTDKSKGAKKKVKSSKKKIK